jgi:copper(I)-binding protein
VTRQTRRLLVGAIAILVPALAGCEAGLNAPTLEYHPASFGLTTTVNGITIDNAFVLGPSLDGTLTAGGQTGMFMTLATQGNNDQLTSVSAPGTAGSVSLANGPVNVTATAPTNLSGPSPEIVLNNLSTSLSGGQTVQIVLNFANAGAVTLNVPVEPAAYEYATFSPPAPSASPSASPSTSATTTGKHKGKKGAGASASASASAGDTASGSDTATPSPSTSVSS